MSEENQEQVLEPKKPKVKRVAEKDIGLNIDKMEYQEIVLSQSNFPDKDYFKRDYFD